MAWTTGTCTSYRDLLAQIAAFATANGWTSMRSLTNYSYNGVLDEREVVLRGDCGTATMPHVGFRTFTEAGSVQGILLAGFTDYSAAAFGSLPNASPVTAPSATAGTYVHVLAAGGSFWLSVTPRRILGVCKAVGGVTAYISFHAGLLNSFRTEVDDPFPFFLASSCAVSTQAPDSTGANVTGIVELASPASVTGPGYWFRSDDSTWKEVKNSEAAATHQDFVLYPFGKPRLFQAGDAKEIVSDSTITFWGEIINHDRSAASRALKCSPGEVAVPVPCVVIATPDGTGSANDYVVGEVHGLFWVSKEKPGGGSIAPEDTITVGARQFMVFPNGAQSAAYQYFAIEMA